MDEVTYNRLVDELEGRRGRELPIRQPVKMMKDMTVAEKERFMYERDEADFGKWYADSMKGKYKFANTGKTLSRGHSELRFHSSGESQKITQRLEVER